MADGTDDLEDRVKLRETKILSDNHYILRKASFDFRRSDGSWQLQHRESYDMGDGAGVLPIDRVRGTVILIRQFRWPPFEKGVREMLVEVPAGKLDGDEPEACIRRESLEEAGIALGKVEQVFEAFVSPGAVTERLYLFLGEYDSAAPRATGGGLHDEGEDIAILELPLAEAYAMVTSGHITDCKTVMLLQAAMLELLAGRKHG